MNETYTVRQLAGLAGVSVRTLHHYDQVGLLTPDRRRNGYRQYGPAAALRLQQIMFYRELGFSLAEIGEIITRPDFDVLAALESHRELLQKRAARLHDLLATVDRTIAAIKGERDMEIREYYEGFNDNEIASMRREARERWGEKAVVESEQRVVKMGKEKFAAVNREMDAVYRSLVAHMGEGPGSPEAQAAVRKWRAWLENFGHYTDEMALGLGRMYSSDERFGVYFRKYHPDLPAFWTKAIEIACGAGQ